MSTEEEYHEHAKVQAIKEAERRSQAYRINNLGFNIVACQLYHWYQYSLSYEDMCRGKRTEKDQA